MLSRLFIDHPRAIGESYGAHFLAAGRFGVSMIGSGMGCLVHAVIPGIFVTRGSDTIDRLHREMVLNRRDRGSRDMR
jgi:hypothetical protein